jgi:putative membrane protein
MESLKVDFRSPQRQSRVAIGIILIKFIKGTIKGFWPILLSLFIGRKAGSTFQDVIGYVVLGFAAFNLIGSVLTYFRFYFHLENNSIVIDKGILRRTKTNIPFERIQTINFTQNILHQLFNVVGVEIDTAGAGKAEISIDALNKEDANALREYILAEKEQLTANNAPASDLVEPAEKKAPQLLLQLKPLDLLKVGISQNHLRSMGIIFVFVFSTINEITDNISDIVADQFTQYEGYLINNTLFVFLTSAILVIIIAFLFSLISTLLQYFDLKLWISKKGLKLVRGLLNREEISINTHKVQLVSWSTLTPSEGSLRSTLYKLLRHQVVKLMFKNLKSMYLVAISTKLPK